MRTDDSDDGDRDGSPSSPPGASCSRTASSRSSAACPGARTAPSSTEVCREDDGTQAVYKPYRGERPLWDFPDGLFKREVAAYELSEALGWHLVPLTVLRIEAPLGEGSLQQFVDCDFEQHYFTLVRGRRAPRAAAGAVRVRPAGQQHRPQERALPARRGRPHLRHRQRVELPPGVQAAHGHLGVRRRAHPRSPARRRAPVHRRRRPRPARRAARPVRARRAADPGPAVVRDATFPIDHSGRRYPWPLV